MSDFDDDIASELLELAGASERPERRKSKNKSSRSSKKRKMHSGSDSEAGSDEGSDDENGDASGEPFPYEGLYLNAKDKEDLLAMPEIKREQVLADRAEVVRQSKERALLAQMVKQNRGMAMDSDDDSVRPAKRQNTARSNKDKEKMGKLDELKAKRKARGEVKKNIKLSPKSHRDRSASPQDMDISSDESEDGMITREEQQEERDRRLMGLSTSSSKRDEDSEEHAEATLEDFNRTRLTRDMVAKWCMHSWFEEYVTGTWVRYLIGNENGIPVYRICEISGLAQDLVKPYKVNESTINQAVDLKHGKSTKQFNMDRISNASFSEREFTRLVRVCKEEKVNLPTKGALQKKREQMRKLEAQPMTDKEITAMIKRKKDVQNTGTGNPTELKMEKQKLVQARSLAMKRHDDEDVANLDRQLAIVQSKLDECGVTSQVAETSTDEAVRRVNERNRRANLEAVRSAELAENERKRKERELAAKAAREGGSAAAAAIAMRHDPSARLKTVPRMFNAATPSTRPGTPASASKPGTPGPEKQSSATNGVKLPAAVGRPSVVSTQIAFEQKLLDTIDIDLGDF